MILKKNVLQVHACICVRKKFLHKSIVQTKKIMHRIVGWKKNSGKMFWVDTLNFISRLLKDFSIDLDLGKRGFFAQ